MGLNDCHRLALPPTVLIPMTCVQITEKSLSNEAALTPSRSGAFAWSSELSLEPGPGKGTCWCPCATFPGAGSANGVGSGGIGSTSVPQCRAGGVLQTLLGMCNLSGESAIQIFSLDAAYNERRNVSQAAAAWPAIRGRLSVPVLSRRGGSGQNPKGKALFNAMG